MTVYKSFQFNYPRYQIKYTFTILDTLCKCTLYTRKDTASNIRAFFQYLFKKRLRCDWISFLIRYMRVSLLIIKFKIEWCSKWISDHWGHDSVKNSWLRCKGCVWLYVSAFNFLFLPYSFTFHRVRSSQVLDIMPPVKRNMETMRKKKNVSKYHYNWSSRSPEIVVISSCTASTLIVMIVYCRLYVIRKSKNHRITNFYREEQEHCM